MRATGAALLALAVAAPGSHAQAVAAGSTTNNNNSNSGSSSAPALLPPHTGALGGLRPLILFHESFFGRDFVHREYAFEDCPSECEVSWDMAREAEAAAVWFHSVWTNRVDEFATQRAHPEALWVWAAAEAPSNWDHSKNQSAGLLPPDPRLDALFNVSMTFQRNSDVLFSYGGCEPAPPRPHASAAAAAARAHAKQVAAWFASKKRAVAWTVSHCWTASRREEYVARLRETTQVDVFGKCADLWGKLMGLGHKHHAALLEHDYKLYLAFENRLCRDYITEKFWVDALLNGAIPVVRGGQSDADYAAVAPPGSYINADWFADAAALGAHLTQVAANETLYASYHAWRVTHRLLVDSKVNWAHSKAAETRATCRLCTLLHERAAGVQPPPRLRLNLTRYWSGADSCRAPADVPVVNVLWAADSDPANGQR